MKDFAVEDIEMKYKIKMLFVTDSEGKRQSFKSYNVC